MSPPQPPPQLLFLGHCGSGKTLLIKSILYQHLNGRPWDFGEVPSVRPTIGSGLSRLALRRTEELELRDLGGQMRAIWADYLWESVGVVFVVDGACGLSASESALVLEDVLRHPSLAAKPVLVAFSKADIEGPMTLIELKNRMFYGDILDKFGGGRVTEVICSAYSGLNIDSILMWMQKRLDK